MLRCACSGLGPSHRTDPQHSAKSGGNSASAGCLVLAVTFDATANEAYPMYTLKRKLPSDQVVGSVGRNRSGLNREQAVSVPDEDRRRGVRADRKRGRDRHGASSDRRGRGKGGSGNLEVATDERSGAARAQIRAGRSLAESSKEKGRVPKRAGGKGSRPNGVDSMGIGAKGKRPGQVRRISW